jgi:hypothetical protein
LNGTGLPCGLQHTTPWTGTSPHHYYRCIPSPSPIFPIRTSDDMIPNTSDKDVFFCALRHGRILTRLRASVPQFHSLHPTRPRVQFHWSSWTACGSVSPACAARHFQQRCGNFSIKVRCRWLNLWDHGTNLAIGSQRSDWPKQHGRISDG